MVEIIIFVVTVHLSRYCICSDWAVALDPEVGRTLFCRTKSSWRYRTQQGHYQIWNLQLVVCCIQRHWFITDVDFGGPSNFTPAPVFIVESKRRKFIVISV